MTKISQKSRHVLEDYILVLALFKNISAYNEEEISIYIIKNRVFDVCFRTLKMKNMLR